MELLCYTDMIIRNMLNRIEQSTLDDMAKEKLGLESPRERIAKQLLKIKNGGKICVE